MLSILCIIVCYESLKIYFISIKRIFCIHQKVVCVTAENCYLGNMSPILSSPFVVVNIQFYIFGFVKLSM